MWHMMKEVVLEPLLRRLGTAVGGYLVGMGVDATSTGQIVTGLTVAVLVGVDLLISARERGRVMEKGSKGGY